eukprot:3808703-Amphidinium_carterae.1
MRAAESPNSRGGLVSYAAKELDELVVDPSMFSAAFANASTHKVHLDRLLELNVNCVCMAETNHTEAPRGALTATSNALMSGS